MLLRWGNGTSYFGQDAAEVDKLLNPRYKVKGIVHFETMKVNYVWILCNCIKLKYELSLALYSEFLSALVCNEQLGDIV